MAIFERIITIAALVFLAVLLRLAVRHRRRQQSMRLLASRMRMRYLPDDTKSVLNRLEGFCLIEQGHSRRISNVVRGRRRGRELLAFDYRCEMGCGQDRIIRSSTAVAWQLLHRDMPSIVALCDEEPEHYSSFGLYGRISTGIDHLDESFDFYSNDKRSLAILADQATAKAFLACKSFDWEIHDKWIVFCSDRVLTILETARLIRLSSRCCRALDRLSLA